MFARVTTYRFDPVRGKELVSRLDGIKARIAEITGVVSVYNAWRDDGNGVTMAVYESKEAAEAIA